MLFAPMIVAALLGLVEGATEFLPVSSTGHLIVTGTLLGHTGPGAESFDIVIQVGAILAVIWHYRHMLVSLGAGLLHSGSERNLILNLLVAFFPAVVIGLLAHGFIKTHLFSVRVVAWALIVGGVIMLLLEWRKPRITVSTLNSISLRQAFGIGLAQLLAMIPGTSRSATTILGGYVLGLSRTAATEFSFLLAIPTICGAAVLDAWKSREILVQADMGMFAVGILVSFIVATLAIRGFLRFIQHHSFVVFAWYRIGFGALILALLASRVI